MPTRHSSRFPRPLTHVLEQDRQLAVWLARYRLENDVARRVLSQLPRLVASQTHVVTSPNTGNLKLIAPSGSVATLLKQRTPELLKDLTAHGYEFNAILVCVQPSRLTKLTSQAEIIPRSPPNKAALARLAEKLRDGPLKQAVCRFAGNRRRETGDG